MYFSFSTLFHMTIACSVLIVIIYYIMLNNKMIIHFGTTSILGIILAIMIRFMLPVEFVFTKSIYIYDSYPDVYLYLINDNIDIFNINVSILDILKIIWILGSVFFLIKSILQYYKLYKAVSSYPRVNNIILYKILHNTNNQFPFHKKDLRLVECPNISTPMIFGLKNPHIIIPHLNLPESKWRYIFLHELTHYYRGHLIHKLLCELMSIIYWWNPFVYLFRYILNNILEMDVDAKVTHNLTDTEKIDYTLCLTTIAKKHLSQEQNTYLSVAFVPTSKSYLHKRVDLITTNISGTKKRYLPTLFIGSIVAIVFIFSLLFVFEPSKRPTEIFSEYGTEDAFSFEEGGMFLIEEPSGEYSVYINYEKSATVTTPPTDDPSIRIYSSYEEALIYEKKE